MRDSEALMKLRVPAGATAAYLNVIYKGKEAEAELLIQRGATIRVLHKDHSGPKLLIEAELIL